VTVPSEFAAAEGGVPHDLEPGLDRFIETIRAGALDPATNPGVGEIRRAAAAVRLGWSHGGAAMAETRDFALYCDGLPVPIRIHYPAASRPLKPLLFLHGGGWTLFSTDTHDRVMREFARATGRAVVGIDYPLAPEHPYPAALRACERVIRHVVGEGSRYGLAGSPAVAGDSAGATLGLAAALELIRQGTAVIEALVLLYGVYDCDLTRPSYALFGSPAFPLQVTRMAWFWDNYCPNPAGRRGPLLSPLHADLHGLPPCRMVIAGQDILRDENLAMAERFRMAGVPLTVDFQPRAVHAFVEALAFAPVAVAVIERAASWLRTVSG
jgi:acetyl esterase